MCLACVLDVYWEGGHGRGSVRRGSVTKREFAAEFIGQSAVTRRSRVSAYVRRATDVNVFLGGCGVSGRRRRCVRTFLSFLPPSPSYTSKYQQ